MDKFGNSMDADARNTIYDTWFLHASCIMDQVSFIRANWLSRNDLIPTHFVLAIRLK